MIGGGGRFITLLDGTVPNATTTNDQQTTKMNTTKSKAYSSASNAKRAAKAAGHAPEAVNITNDADGYYWELLKPAKPAKEKSIARQKANKAAAADAIEFATKHAAQKAAKSAEAPKTEIKSPVIDASNPENFVLADGRTEEEIIAKGDIGYSCRNGGDPILIIRKSATKNPVQVVWDIFDELKKRADAAGEKLSRKDSIAHAVSCGIAFYTARTQYQSWKTANKF